MPMKRVNTNCHGSRLRPLSVFLCLGLAAALALPERARAEDVTPKISADRIEDVPSTKPDPFPAFDNFAWRSFVALNWPSLPDLAHRGEPDRSRWPGDPGLRVWETFKSRYELFQVGRDGKPHSPSLWLTDRGRNPCGPDADNRGKTLASFIPFADFNEASFSVGEFLNPLVAQNGTYTRYEIRLNRLEYEAIAAAGWAQGRSLPDEGRPADLPVGSISVRPRGGP